MAIYANEIGVLRLHSYFERTLISSEGFTLAPFTYSASLMQHASVSGLRKITQVPHLLTNYTTATLNLFTDKLTSLYRFRGQNNSLLSKYLTIVSNANACVEHEKKIMFQVVTFENSRSYVMIHFEKGQVIAIEINAYERRRLMDDNK